MKNRLDNEPNWKESKTLPVWITIFIIIVTYLIIKEPTQANKTSNYLNIGSTVLKITQDLINVFLWK